MRVKSIVLLILFLTNFCFRQMAINPYDWKKIDPSTVENGFTISFGKDFQNSALDRPVEFA